MGAGRPPDGPKHVERLDGEDEAKRRLRVVIETLSGGRSIEDACAELGVSPSRFHDLRNEAMQGALGALAPGVSGRPKQPAPEPDPDRLAALERQNQELHAELLASMVRTEIALGMPHLFTKKARAEIKKKARDARRWLKGASRGRGSGT